MIANSNNSSSSNNRNSSSGSNSNNSSKIVVVRILGGMMQGCTRMGWVRKKLRTSRSNRKISNSRIHKVCSG